MSFQRVGKNEIFSPKCHVRIMAFSENFQTHFKIDLKYWVFTQITGFRKLVVPQVSGGITGVRRACETCTCPCHLTLLYSGLAANRDRLYSPACKYAQTLSHSSTSIKSDRPLPKIAIIRTLAINRLPQFSFWNRVIISKQQMEKDFE